MLLGWLCTSSESLSVKEISILVYWSDGVLEYWKNPGAHLFSIIPILCIALFDDQAVNPASAITLFLQAHHKP